MKNTQNSELLKSLQLVAEHYEDKHHNLWNGEQQHSLSNDEFNLQDNQLQAIFQELQNEANTIVGGVQ